VKREEYTALNDVLDLFGDITQQVIFPSKGEARKMIQGGGLSINKVKVDNPNQLLYYSLLQEKYLLVQKGKKNYYIVEVI
jgi:tyrosyl-tRNA synthetase